WKGKKLFILDEVSMMGSPHLVQINDNLNVYRPRKEEQDENSYIFGGIPLVLFTGDFMQFEPVKATSVARDVPKIKYPGFNQVRHTQGRNLFLRFTNVVMLDEQVRANGDAVLRGLLTRLRSGRQTANDARLLNTKVIPISTIDIHEPSSKVITPLNRHGFDLSLELSLTWARHHQQPVTFFISEIEFPEIRRPDAALIRAAMREGEQKIPGVFVFAPGIPVMLNKNKWVSLKAANGTEFRAVAVIPDPKYAMFEGTPGVQISTGPPRGVLLQGPGTDKLSIEGIPAGTILIKP
ncbi:hypothetical protein QBC39DRAFT_243997, partial [Podospora conica]